jgi:hypothetical protein
VIFSPSLSCCTNPQAPGEGEDRIRERPSVRDMCSWRSTSWSSPADVSEVHRLQDAVVVRQPDVGAFDVPAWDEASEKGVSDALTALDETLLSPD